MTKIYHFRRQLFFNPRSYAERLLIDRYLYYMTWFQSTLLREERHKNTATASVIMSFQSTLLRGRRLLLAIVATGANFQSTLLREGDLPTVIIHKRYFAFSIHAPTARSDHINKASSFSSFFQSTLLRGRPVEDMDVLGSRLFNPRSYARSDG